VRRTSLAQCALATALVCACAPPDGEPETETEEPAAQDPRSVPPVDSWDEFESLRAPVAVEWSFDALDGQWGDLSFPVKLQSHWDEPLEADVFAFVVTPGVDEDVETQLPLWSGELTPNDPLELMVASESLPPLTPGLPVDLRVIARVYGPEGQALAIHSQSRRVELTDDGETMLAAPRPEHADVEEALFDASRAYIGTQYLESPTGPELAAQSRGAAGPYGIDVTARVCPQWRVHYLDNLGATVINAADQQRIAASYAKVVVSTPSDVLSGAFTGTVVAEDWLDEFGCTELTLPAGPYVLALVTQLQRGEQAIDIEGRHTRFRVPDPPEDVDLTIATAAFRMPGSGLFDIYRLTDVDDRRTRAAAVLSQALVEPDLPYLGPGKLRVYANNRCQTWVDSAACGSNLQIHIGDAGIDTPMPVDMTEFRNVIAHELGHAIQYRGSRGFAAAYATPSDLPDVCTCDHITPPTSHCLQSLEDHGAAFAEGFAHFVAARLFNSDPSGCEFQYYKPLYWTPLIVGQPPLYTTSCDLEIQWEQSRDCSRVGNSIEYDWLNFLWGLNHGPTEERWTVQDLHDLFGSPCTDLVTGRCELSWSWLEAAVDASSVSPAKKMAFHAAAAAHGLAE